MNNIFLIQRAKEGDHEAFAQVLNNFKPLIYSIINSHHLKSYDYEIEKEDLYQEACIALHDAINNFVDKGKALFSTYAYVVIYRRVMRYVCKERKRYQYESYSLNEKDLDYVCDLQSVRVSENPEAYYANNQRLDAITDFLAQLSEEDRTIIGMRIDNYSYREIADKIGSNTKRIDNRLQKIKRNFCVNDKEEESS